MRLGGQCFLKTDDPGAWAAEIKRLGYGAAYCPVDGGEPAKIRAFAEAAQKANIVIAEVGAFGNNPISPDDEVRRTSIANCRERLALADRIGARCCVNCSASRGGAWAGHHPDNLTAETFDLVVESVREIIDGVRPARTFYTLEPMPWMYPDSADSYLSLLKAVDRKQFGAHLDPVNLVCSPQIYYNNGAMIRECIQKLGPHLKCCHAKDIILGDKLTVHLDETRPGLGRLDYRTFLAELETLDPDMPVMIEHLKTPEDYALAADAIRSVAREIGVSLR